MHDVVPIPEPIELARMTDVALLHVVGSDGRCLHCREVAGPTGRCWAELVAAERLAEAGRPHPHGWPAGRS